MSQPLKQTYESVQMTFLIEDLIDLAESFMPTRYHRLVCTRFGRKTRVLKILQAQNPNRMNTSTSCVFDRSKPSEASD